MSVKITPPPTTTEKPLLAVTPSHGQLQGVRKDGVLAQPMQSTPPPSEVDTRATLELVEITQDEGLELHEKMLEQLRDRIASGNYTADLDVVAERVAEVLGPE